ncbi:family 16 glycosylhydrolase [Limnohabitans sp. G3-2]|uniref:glycoside hydrolase family 16 protein n=1 Tax=Limnohabitans sp. G3-2 TaxID=1100711 RepID=UPI0013043E27|nr:glycoside hydrolase family 16 protein [Limnohabitans sp. G3-2]
MFTPSKVLKGMWAAGLMATMVACGGGGDSSPTAPALTLSKPDSYVLKWSDEFDTVGAPGSAWTYDLGSPLLGGTVWGNSEKQYYTSDAANVSVSNGMLTIQPVQGVPSGAPTGYGLLATSSRIKTDTSEYYNALNATPYGFYEIRAKVPCVAGAWPAIWMMGRNGDWPARGEVDIMEWFGGVQEFRNQPNQVQSAVHTTYNHWGTVAGLLYAKRNVANMCSEFHRFQLHWTANEILIGVDEVPTFSYKKASNAGTDKWPFDQPAHILLNVAVGGNLGGPVNLSDLPAMALQVDYVKVWQNR